MTTTDNHQKTHWPQKLAVSKHGMVSSQHRVATEAGVAALENGGNAIDAAVAAGLALGVCEPQASGLGGQTMMMIHLSNPNKTIAIDGSSRAPNRAALEVLRKKSCRLYGYRATTVPSTPAVLSYAAEKYGNLPFSDLLEPAISAAKTGFPVSELYQRLVIREQDNWGKGNAAGFFKKNGTTAHDIGELLLQPTLSGTLERLKERGVDDFYRGEIASEIVSDMEKNNGFIHLDDLANIPYPIERRPVSSRFGGYRLMTFPPPGAGRTLVEMCNIWSLFPEKLRNINTLDGLGVLVETIRRAQLDRRDRPFDPNFYPQVQDRRMLSDDYAALVGKQIRSRIRIRKKGSGETTHLTVMDRMGNVVALTQSIERVFGSFVATPSLGFLYNNYMSAFEIDDITHPYYLRANSVPWASVAPTILYRGKKPFMAMGSPGSERIASSLFQVLIRLESGMPPLDAITAPRLHCNEAGTVMLEGGRFRDDLSAFLEERGYSIKEKEPFAFYMGCVQMVMREGKSFIGVADPRRDGHASGPAEMGPKRPPDVLED